MTLTAEMDAPVAASGHAAEIDIILGSFLPLATYSPGHLTLTDAQLPPKRPPAMVLFRASFFFLTRTARGV